MVGYFASFTPMQPNNNQLFDCCRVSVIFRNITSNKTGIKDVRLNTQCAERFSDTKSETVVQ